MESSSSYKYVKNNQTPKKKKLRSISKNKLIQKTFNTPQLSKKKQLQQQKFLTSSSLTHSQQWFYCQQIEQQINQINRLFQQQKYSQSQPLLEQLYLTITVTNYPGQKFKNLHFSIYFCNLAYFYQLQLQGDLYKCNQNLTHSIYHIRQFIRFLRKKQQILAYNTQFLKLNMQYFACLSNVSKHEQAISASQTSLCIIKESLKILKQINHENMYYSNTPNTTTSISPHIKQKINFKQIVLQQADKLLSSIQISSPYRLITENKQQFMVKLKNMYFWKNNNQNNANNIRKEFKQKGLLKLSSARNLLGVRKSSTFTQQFSLGELMSLTPQKMRQPLNTDQYFLLSSQKIIQLIVFASICYFTMATQTRFKQISEDINQLKITQKYQKLNNNQIIFRCKVLHLKAIELVAGHLSSNNAYFKHILNSFNKNYKSLMDEINQEQESSMKSYDISVQNFKRENMVLSQSEYGIRKIPLKKNLSPCCSSKKYIVQKIVNCRCPQTLIKKRSLSKQSCIKPVRKKQFQKK